MRSKSLTIWVVLVVLVVTGSTTRADFILYDNEQLTVNSTHTNGYLYNTSRVSIVSGGYISDNLYSYNYSTVNISGGWVWILHARDYSTTNISGNGDATSLYSYGYSITNMSGGYINYNLRAYDDSTTNMSGGNINYSLYAYGYSTVNISGGHISDNLYAYGYSTVNMSGGYISDNLDAYDYSIVTFFGQNFHYGSGLTLDGNRVLGIGILSGEWLDGTPWAMNINENYSTATILAIPEPTTLLLLGFGGLALRKKCRAK